MGVVFAWISLDSLVRIETYQWVMRDKARKSFLCRFSFGDSSVGTETRQRRDGEG
jgi:hypothetical protein